MTQYIGTYIIMHRLVTCMHTHRLHVTLLYVCMCLYVYMHTNTTYNAAGWRFQLKLSGTYSKLLLLTSDLFCAFYCFSLAPFFVHCFAVVNYIHTYILYLFNSLLSGGVPNPRALLDLLFTKEEQKASILLPSKKSDKPPLDQEKVQQILGMY